jgi:anoctamin-10/anoctamin-7
MKVELDDKRLKRMWEVDGVKHPDWTPENKKFVQLPIEIPPVEDHPGCGPCGCGLVNGLVYGHELDPYTNIFAPYDEDERYDSLYFRANRLDRRDQDADDRASERDNPFYFREVDRIKLMLSIIASKSNPYNGCELDVPMLLEKKGLMAFYPLHNEKAQKWLFKEWMRFDTVPNSQPFDEIKDYFGEQIALYFHWLAEYTTWLAVPGFIGIFLMIDETDEGSSDTNTAPFFGLMMCFWSTCFLESWKRRETKVALEAGMAGFEDAEAESVSVRPQYKGKMVASRVNGKQVLVHDPMQKAKAVFVGILAVSSLTLIALVAVSFIVFFKFQWTQENADGTLTSGMETSDGFKYGGPLVTGINAVQIIVFGVIYEELAAVLNDMENHRTDTVYDDSLITKVFSFQFINSYTTMFYTAFLKETIERAGGPFVDANSTSAGCHAFRKEDQDDPSAGACMNELSNLLSTIFITQLVVGNIQEIAVPWVMGKIKHAMEARGGNGAQLSVTEAQFFKEDYENEKGLFKDYMEMILQFGYATMFVTAYPLAPLLAVINNYIEIRVDAFKLLKGTRRPEPKGAEDIGTWQYILEIMSTASVITNSLLICFTGTKLTKLCLPDENNVCQGLPMNYTLLYWRLALFVVLEHVFMFFKTGLGLAIPDVPEDVLLQRKRNDNFVAKIVRLQMDEVDDDEDGTAISAKANLTIFTSDDPNENIPAKKTVDYWRRCLVSDTEVTQDECTMKGDRL